MTTLISAATQSGGFHKTPSPRTKHHVLDDVPVIHSTSQQPLALKGDHQNDEHSVILKAASQGNLDDQFVKGILSGATPNLQNLEALSLQKQKGKLSVESEVKESADKDARKPIKSSPKLLSSSMIGELLQRLAIANHTRTHVSPPNSPQLNRRSTKEVISRKSI